MIKLITLDAAPPFAEGRVRDLRVRWALQESGLPYEVELVSMEGRGEARYRDLQPFGQVPVLVDDGLCLFESGAIVLHIAEKSGQLVPIEHAARERVRAWIFAALNTVEPSVSQLTVMDREPSDAPGKAERRPQAKLAVDRRLDSLQYALGKNAYFAGDFSAADLIMTTVLRFLDNNYLESFPALADFRQRCEARPAFKSALAEQLAQTRFGEASPTASASAGGSG